MMASDLIRIIGVSHLLQPPLTLLLASAKGINLQAAVMPTTPLAREVLVNMAFASVFLPTALGGLLACYAASALEPGAARTLGALISLFWCWRLYRQSVVLRPLWPCRTLREVCLNVLLTAIFAIQGPGLGLLLVLF
jgi:hypothetical protein